MTASMRWHRIKISNIFVASAACSKYFLAMMQNALLFLVLVGTSFAAQAQVDTVRASTLPGPQLAEKAYNSGLASFNQQRYPAALASFDQAIAAKPDFTAAYTNRAATRYELKEYPQALTDYD